MFIVGIPAIMWLASGKPELGFNCSWNVIVGIIIVFSGLILSVWTIIYMKVVGRGNPMDAFDHEIAPHTQHLMTGGVYRICRNPMLLGTFLYLAGIVLLLFSWQSAVVWVIFVIIMSFQVSSEEKRLERDFGQEYLDYRKRTGRFTPWP
jgi:protein-S-isoprenylcysteine O-methyltransferase Ste14